MTAMSRCHRCDEGFTSPGAILHHIRLIHPELWESIERWPDGSIVWHDPNPAPEEITGEVA